MTMGTIQSQHQGGLHLRAAIGLYLINIVIGLLQMRQVGWFGPVEKCAGIVTKDDDIELVCGP